MECSCMTGSERLFLASSRGICRECRKPAEVRYVALGGKVYLERCCEEHGLSYALVAETIEGYLEASRAPSAARPPASILTERTSDCPMSCGPCGFHAQRCNLPVFSITNACELRCPICFTYNREDKTYFMEEGELDRHLDTVLKASSTVDLINITGGEPTLHPNLVSMLRRAKRPGVGRITMNTNGLRLAEDRALAAELAELGVYVILSLDTLDKERSVRIHGGDITAKKRAALQVLGELDIPTTLLMVLIGGVNETDIDEVLDIALTRDFVRSLTVQTMTYTGQGGGAFLPREPIPVDAAARLIEEHSRGRLRREWFMPLPTAHPLCYRVAYLLNGEVPRSLTELISKEQVAAHLSDGYLLSPSSTLERDLQDAVNLKWAQGVDPSLLREIKAMLSSLYPQKGALTIEERRRLAERRIKTIYLHAHMDEDTYEIGRAMRCPDQVPIEGGRMVGACNYNLFYRMNDERFWKCK